MTKEQRLKALEAEYESLQPQLQMLSIGIHELRCDIVKEKYHFDIGTIVICDGKVFQVAKIYRIWNDGKPWLQGRILKKDGTWGKALIHLWCEWEVKTVEGEADATSTKAI